MKKLIPPTLDAESIYQFIKDNSHSEEKKKKLEHFQSYVFERYLTYDTLKNNLEGITSSTIIDTEDKDALHSCYTRNSKGFLEGAVVTKIIKAQSAQHKQNCPYCGLDKPRTIDHYLPKGKFPEFSVFPPNLIPCCGYCNQKKSSTWLTNGKRHFLNLYFDEIPSDIPFLFAEMEYREGELVPSCTFTIENKHNIDHELFELIVQHYTRLQLLNEFSESVEERLSSIQDEIVHNPETIEDIKDALVRKYHTNVRKFGLNHWESSFLKSLINTPEFFVNSLEFGA